MNASNPEAMRDAIRHSVVMIAAAASVAALTAGCSGQPSQTIIDRNVAVRDFIDLRRLESLRSINTRDSDGWETITPTYLIYRTRRADYLFEFARPCHDLFDNSRIIADERFEPNVIRARFETLRGCRIAAIYALSEAEALELENIGFPPAAD